MAVGDLTTVANVQSWLSDNGQQPVDTGGQLARLVSAMSASALAYMQRAPFYQQTLTDRFTGRGGRSYFLKEWPVLGIVGVTLNGRVLSASSNGSVGWVLDPWDGNPPGGPQSLSLIGYDWEKWPPGGCQVAYQKGYVVQGEQQTVPASGPYQITAYAALGFWTQDQGVSYAATGAALAPVPASPAVGQYAVAGGVYTFNAGDAGAALLLAYSFVPMAVEQALIEWIGLHYKARGWIGMKTQNFGQTSTSYDLSDVPAVVRGMLAPYRKVLPL